MRREPRRRFWVDVLLALVSAALFAITLVWHDWIELIFGVDPDEGNGLVELLVSGSFLAMTLVFAVFSRLEWRRGIAVSRSVAAGSPRAAQATRALEGISHGGTDGYHSKAGHRPCRAICLRLRR
jgi:hypothetical protein